jgi:hypothetical protein
VYSFDDVFHDVSILIELSQECCEVRHGVVVFLCGCVGDAAGDVGIPPVVEMGRGEARLPSRLMMSQD